jgi:penicillin-binding protein 1A
MIAGLPQAPSRYSPYYKKENAINRQHQVLKRMLKMKYITPEEYDKAYSEELVLNPNHSPYSLNKAPYFIDYVLDELEELGFSEQQISNGGYRVITTLNYKDQKAAQDAVSNGLKSWGLSKPDDQAALFSFDVSTGKILAYVGGKDYIQSQFNRVTDSVRQPGSAFKMFVYTAAVLNGVKADDVFDDTPLRIGNWSPRNYGNKYRGKIPVKTALAISSNVVAVRLMQQVGVGEVHRITRSMGITTPIAHDLTIALGSSGVKLFDITRAYGVLANSGIKVKPYSVEKVVTSTGRVLYQAEPEQDKVLDIYTAATMTGMLEGVIKKGTGTAARIPDRQIAGKTGTTDSYRDAWFVAYSPEIVTGVWVGNDKKINLTEQKQVEHFCQIWTTYMKVALSDFQSPNLIIRTWNLRRN